MQSNAVVPHRDVLHNIGTGLRTRLVIPPVDPLRLQFPEETFNNAVIPTVSFSAHAPQNAVGPQKAPEFMTRIELRGRNERSHLPRVADSRSPSAARHRPDGY